MKINPKHDVQSVARIERATKKTTNPAAAQTDFLNSANLTTQLAAIPDVRADKVARAKALIADPNYPSAKTVRAIAHQLTGKIQPAPDAES